MEHLKHVLNIPNVLGPRVLDKRGIKEAQSELSYNLITIFKAEESTYPFIISLQNYQRTINF